MPPTYSYGCWLPSSLVSQAVLVTPEPMLQSPRLVWLPSVVTPEVQLFGGGDGGGGEGGLQTIWSPATWLPPAPQLKWNLPLSSVRKHPWGRVVPQSPQLVA